MSITIEIGGLGRKPDSRLTEAEISTFCRNLETSMLRALGEGWPVRIETKTDAEPVTAPEQGYGDCVIDAAYMGATVSVHFGRPANRRCERGPDVKYDRQHWREKVRQLGVKNPVVNAILCHRRHYGFCWEEAFAQMVTALADQNERLSEQAMMALQNAPPLPSAAWSGARADIAADLRAVREAAERQMREPQPIQVQPRMEYVPAASPPELIDRLEKLSPQKGDILVLHTEAKRTAHVDEAARQAGRLVSEYLEESGRKGVLVFLSWPDTTLKVQDEETMRKFGWVRAKPTLPEHLDCSALEAYRSELVNQLAKGLGIQSKMAGAFEEIDRQMVENTGYPVKELHGPSPLKKAFTAWQEARLAGRQISLAEVLNAGLPVEDLRIKVDAPTTEGDRAAERFKLNLDATPPAVKVFTGAAGNNDLADPANWSPLGAPGLAEAKDCCLPTVPDTLFITLTDAPAEAPVDGGVYRLGPEAPAEAVPESPQAATWRDRPSLL